MNNLLNPSEFKNENNKNRKLNRRDLNKTIKKKRQQKNYSLEHLTSNMNGNDDSDDESSLANFNPPPAPVVQSKTTIHTSPPSVATTSQNYADTTTDDAVTTETFRDMNTNTAYPGQYHNGYVPYYAKASDQQQVHGNKDELLEKLNYMIHLMEENKDETTGHVTEELILYCFLGVFVIFTIDSFARVGKYIR
jgi:hypothetical protein